MDISIVNGTVHVEKESAPKDQVVVEMVDYGDEFFDVHFKDLRTNTLLGCVAMCGIPGREKATTYANECAAKAGGVPVNVIRDDTWQQYC